MLGKTPAQIHFYIQRFNRDQSIFRRNFQIEGVFASIIVDDAINRLVREAHVMAGKPPKKYQNAFNTEFVNVQLSEGQKKDFLKWKTEQAERIADLIGQIAVDDYKITCSWDARNQCYIASFTGKEDQRHNEHRSMSSRSDDWYEAIALNVYKHVVVFHEGTWEGDNTKNNWG